MKSDLERASSPEPTALISRNNESSPFLVEGRNICRALAITAVQREGGVDYILYARVSRRTLSVRRHTVQFN